MNRIYAWSSFLALVLVGSVALTCLIFVLDLHFGWER